jgi:uncharacterized damage-inducible protein DinB
MRSLTIMLVVALVGAATGRAVEPGNGKTPKGFRGEFLWQAQDAESKLIDLAKAIPGEKYGWRPGEGVRSVSEVFVHIAASNYMYPSLVGVKMPLGLGRDMEKTVTEKTKVLDVLRQSFEHIRKAIMNTGDADLNKPAALFKQESTVRGVYFLAAVHMHEHLGQMIAYARMNAIVPPWTAEEQARQQNKQANE